MILHLRSVVLFSIAATLSTVAPLIAQSDALDIKQEADAEFGSAENPTASSAAPASVFVPGGGVNGVVYAAVALADGSVVIGGEFNEVANQQRSNVARILADGTLDPVMFATFSDGVDGTVYALAVDSGGGVIVGGYFSNAHESPRQNLVRYTTDGKLDLSFGGTQAPFGPNGKVMAIAVQPDGSIVIGGEFTEVGTVQRKNVARLNSNGTASDPSAATQGVDGVVQSLAVAANGDVIVSGLFEIGKAGSQNITTLKQ